MVIAQITSERSCGNDHGGEECGLGAKAGTLTRAGASAHPPGGSESLRVRKSISRCDKGRDKAPAL